MVTVYYDHIKQLAPGVHDSLIRFSTGCQTCGFDAERLEHGQAVPHSASLKLPLEAEARIEEAIRLWTASRRTEMPEGTIVRCDLLGISTSI